jgi:hypothetical protein
MVENVCMMTLSHYPLSTLSLVIIHNPGLGREANFYNAKYRLREEHCLDV